MSYIYLVIAYFFSITQATECFTSHVCTKYVFKRSVHDLRNLCTGERTNKKLRELIADFSLSKGNNGPVLYKVGAGMLIGKSMHFYSGVTDTCLIRRLQLFWLLVYEVLTECKKRVYGLGND